MKIVFPLSILTLGLFASLAPLSAAVMVVTNPATFTGTSAINSSNRTLTSASGATSVATLEAISGFSGIHDFVFTGNESTSTQYVFDFTSINAIDVRIQYTGTVSTGSTVQATNATFSTSVSSSFRFGAPNSSTVGLRIDFGTYNSGLDAFSADKTVSAMGLTLPTGASANPITIDISYFDASNNLLSSQSYTTSSSATTYGYSGYQTTGAPISYALLSYTTGTGSLPAITMDDLSFAAVPEPQVTLLLGSASVMLLLLRRRSAKARLS